MSLISQRSSALAAFSALARASSPIISNGTFALRVADYSAVLPTQPLQSIDRRGSSERLSATRGKFECYRALGSTHTSTFPVHVIAYYITRRVGTCYHCNTLVSGAIHYATSASPSISRRSFNTSSGRGTPLLWSPRQKQTKSFLRW